MLGSERAETMGDKNDRARRTLHFLDDAVAPGGKPRLLPIGLNHAALGRDFGFPAALAQTRRGPV